jgi:CBS domain containing-hemolysin-like protein
LAIAIPTKAALALVPLLYLLAQLVRPIVGALNAISNVILKLLSFKPVDEANTAFTLEQVAGIVSESRREGKLTDAAGTITKTIEFTEKRVRDIAVPVGQLVILDELATAAELQQAVASHGFSRYPVSTERGEISGYWHIKDSLAVNGEDVPGSQQKRIRPMVSVSANAELEDALAQLRRSGAHIARSFDSAGNLTGCLFLEDIIEELVGEIEDATRRN